MRTICVVSVVSMLALTACTAPATSDDLRSQLLGSEAGITDATVSTVADGLATNLRIGVVLEADSVTSADLREILTLACPSSDGTTYTDVIAQGRSGAWLDLEPAYVELGFPPAGSDESPPHDFHYGSEAMCATLGLTDD